MVQADDRILLAKIRLVKSPGLRTPTRINPYVVKDPESSYSEIINFLNAQVEWLLIDSAGRGFSVKRDEFDLEHRRGRLLFGSLTEKGYRTWRVRGYKFSKEKLMLDCTPFAGETEKLTMIGRLSAGELLRTGQLARIEKAERLAKAVLANYPKFKILSVSLNWETGRASQIQMQTPVSRIALVADVSDSLTPEVLLAGTILWLEKLRSRKKDPVGTAWILVEKKRARPLRKLHSMLSNDWKRRIHLKLVTTIESDAAVKLTFKDLPPLDISELWREKAQRFRMPEVTEPSKHLESLISDDRGKTDAVWAKNGQTARFLGLPFARVRKLFGYEKMWFGTNRTRQLLVDHKIHEFRDLMASLRNYRRFDSPNKRHELFRQAPEAWLESLLRKNIKAIDTNLILSPLHIQFRAEKDKIDLLALRRDGRLVIIEIKVSPDREMILQAIDYWRKIEIQRRAGNLQNAKIFGELEIRNEPPLVYLIAPLLSFHKDFESIAGTVSREIEIYRIDLAENWREKLKVIRRERIN